MYIFFFNIYSSNIIVENFRVFNIFLLFNIDYNIIKIGILGKVLRVTVITATAITMRGM